MELFCTIFRGVWFNTDRRHLYLLFKENKEWKNFDKAFRVYVYTICVAFGVGTSKSVSRIGYRLHRYRIFSYSRWWKLMYISFKTSALVLGLTMFYIHYILKSLFQTVKQQESKSNCLYVFGAEIKIWGSIFLLLHIRSWRV